jgi:hypothetical protein
VAGRKPGPFGIMILNLPPNSYESMNMQVGGVAPVRTGGCRRAGRRLYLPTIMIAGLAAWLSWRGWTALEQTGVVRAVDDGRFQLAGPVVLGFVLAVCFVEQLVPAQRRPLFARGHLMLALTGWLLWQQRGAR